MHNHAQLGKRSLAGRSLVLVGVFLSVATVGEGLAEGMVLIANESVEQDVIRRDDLVRIYLGKLTRWNDDTQVHPVMLKQGAVHEEFVSGYLDRPVYRFVTYWRQMVFTGKGVPPRSFSSEAELISFVGANPGTLGYASGEISLQGVKTLKIE